MASAVPSSGCSRMDQLPGPRRLVQIQRFGRDDRPHVGDRSRRKIPRRAMEPAKANPMTQQKQHFSTLICEMENPATSTSTNPSKSNLLVHPIALIRLQMTRPKLLHRSNSPIWSFDRQWIIPDARLINQPNPNLWKAASGKQVYLTALRAQSPESGPALTVAGLEFPDLDHYRGPFGGRAFPLWADGAATDPNMPAALLAELSAGYGRLVSGPDLFAYIAAVAASPAYTERFRANLKQPGLRIPITAERTCGSKTVVLGREVVRSNVRRAFRRGPPARAAARRQRRAYNPGQRGAAR